MGSNRKIGVEPHFFSLPEIGVEPEFLDRCTRPFGPDNPKRKKLRFDPNFPALLVLTLMIAPAQPSWAGADPGAGDPEHGKELFESDLGCNVCHGVDATGAVGPNIRQVTIEQVYHALQNFPDMINWQYNNPDLFEEQALLDIVAYLQTLEREPAAD